MYIYLIMLLCTLAVLIALIVQSIRLINLILELAGKQSKDRSYDTIDGYLQEVSWQWFDMSKTQRKALFNGVGPEKWPEPLRRLLNEVTGFDASSQPHDVDYAVYRTAEERKIADERFFRNCVRVVITDAKGLTGILKTLLTSTSESRKLFHRIMLARSLYRALRVGGLVAFNASSKLDFKVRGHKAAPIVDLVE